MSSVHAIFIAAMSLYLVFFSDLFSDDLANGPITYRNSQLSSFTLGVMIVIIYCFYFTFIGFICWCTF